MQAFPYSAARAAVAKSSRSQRKTFRKVLAGKKTVKSIVKNAMKYAGESKYFDTAFTGTSLTDVGELVLLTDDAQGTTDITHIGDRITPMFIDMTYQVVLATASRLFCNVRIIVLRWMVSTNDASPSVSDILDYSDSVNACNAPFIHDKRSQFNVLHDTGPVLLQSLGVDQGGARTLTVSKRLKLAGKEVEYYSGGTSAKNHIYVLMIADVDTSNLPYIRGVFRLNYKD